jgi:hypothetical protein
MVYLDTSFVAPLVLEESTSRDVERFIRRLPAGEPAVRHWTRVEFSSLLAREVRMGGLAPDVARKVDREFEAIIEESFQVLKPEAADFERGKRLLLSASTGLRAGDALHLAIAENRGAEAIYSLDRTMIRAGAALGLPVSRGI